MSAPCSPAMDADLLDRLRPVAKLLLGADSPVWKALRRQTRCGTGLRDVRCGDVAEPMGADIDQVPVIEGPRWPVGEVVDIDFAT